MIEKPDIKITPQAFKGQWPKPIPRGTPISVHDSNASLAFGFVSIGLFIIFILLFWLT